MWFWIISIGVTVATAAALARAMWRRSETETPARSDVAIYRDQLREVERDLARGVINETEAEAVRTEVSRRLLEADKASRSDPEFVSDTASHGTIAVVVVLIIGGAAGLYGYLGAPGYPDLPLERRIALAEEVYLTRPNQATAEADIPPAPPESERAEAEFLELLNRLRDTVEARPGDLQGQQLLARNEARLGNFTAAYTAQAQVIAIKGGEVSAQDYVEHAELMVLAAGGYVSPEAEASLREALSRDPENGAARYHSGLLAIQTGRPDIAYDLWRRLLEEGPADAPWIPPIQAEIGQLAQMAGVNLRPSEPVTGPGPSQEDIDAASEMSDEDRMAMIEGMVEGLSDRLARQGGPPEEWAQLIRALGVLGQTDRARAIWTEAQSAFPEEGLVLIREAARAAGVAE